MFVRSAPQWRPLLAVMSSKEQNARISVSLHNSDPEKADFDQDLNRLREKCQKQIIREYDSPTTKVSALDILEWANPYEILLMAVGAVLAIGSGYSAQHTYVLKSRGGASANYCYYWRSNQCFWWICNSEPFERRCNHFT